MKVKFNEKIQVVLLESVGNIKIGMTKQEVRENMRLRESLLKMIVLIT